MLKTVNTSENGCGETPKRRLFSAPQDMDSARNTGRCFRFPRQGGNCLNQKRTLSETSQKKRQDYRSILYTGFLGASLAPVLCQPAFAADNLWTKASEVMKDVYTQILSISTIAAIVTAAVALVMMNFSRSGRTVDESRAWLKRIVVTWIILNSLGFIMSYITPFFAGGQWTAP